MNHYQVITRGDAANDRRFSTGGKTLHEQWGMYRAWETLESEMIIYNPL